MKLISMTDFVFKIGNNNKHESYNDDLAKIYNYATFLRQPLELGMFVPCDEKGSVLDEPTEKDEFRYCNGIEYYPHKKKEYLQKYQQAKERCLFKGNFNICSKRNLIRFNNIMQPLECLGNIESLIKYNLQITKTAIHQLRLSDN